MASCAMQLCRESRAWADSSRRYGHAADAFPGASAAGAVAALLEAKLWSAKVFVQLQFQLQRQFQVLHQLICLGRQQQALQPHS